MQITAFGASGGIGQHFIRFATERGHLIRAVYRAAPAVPPSGQVEILVSPNIFDPEFIGQAIAGVDVVITALGPTFVKFHNPLSRMVSPPDIHQRLARTLVSAMKAAGAPTRLISVSTGSMGPGDAAMGIGPRLLLGLFRTFVARNLKLVGRDLAVMEHELATSGLDWYAVRPAKLTDGPLTRRVQASERFAMTAISRADVAWYMLCLAEDPQPRLRTPMLVSATACQSSEFGQLAAPASETRKVGADAPGRLSRAEGRFRPYPPSSALGRPGCAARTPGVDRRKPRLGSEPQPCTSPDSGASDSTSAQYSFSRPKSGRGWNCV